MATRYNAEADPALRPGLYTTEFLVTVLVLVSATILMLVGQIAPEDWRWAVGLVTAGYTVSRGLAKVS